MPGTSRRASRFQFSVGLALALGLPGATAGAAGPDPLRARWVGQDGHDFVGIGPDDKPNDVQDIHLAVTGLAPGRDVVKLTVNAHGGGQWNNPGPWKADLVRKPGATTGDVFFEPDHPETGRPFTLKVEYDDGRKAETTFPGGKADPNRRMPNASLALKWGGQSGRDLVGTSPAVGPDGIQDARLIVSKLSARFQVRTARLTCGGKACWVAGLNVKDEWNAELVRNSKDPASAEFFFQPDRNLAGVPMKLTITYDHGRTDHATVTGGRVDPKLGMPRSPMPRLVQNRIRAKWLGQDGSRVIGPGDAHIVLSGLPAGRSIESIALSDSVQGYWSTKPVGRNGAEKLPEGQSFVVRRGAEPDTLDLFLSPYRDFAGTAFTVRASFRGGEMAVAQFDGGPTDQTLRVPAVAPGQVTAKPGDDLGKLAEAYGTVILSRGTYTLRQPLVLNRAVTLRGEPGAVLVFEQDPSSRPWTTAIKIHEGRTTLEGFAIRFAGPIRWDPHVSYGPALIGVTEATEGGRHGPKVGLSFLRLDVEAPPARDPSKWEDGPRLMRLVGAQSGRIVGNTFRGGTIEFFGGPWEITDNEYRGTPPGTVSHGFVAAHYSHDLRVQRNRAQPVAPCGKSWRFLVMTGRGFNDRVEDNVTVHIGPRDDDKIPWNNSPETMLTESYRLSYEGKPAEISADRRVVRVGPLQGGPPGTGDVVAVLAGSGAGQWRKIAQTIDPNTYLLETPLPEGVEAVSVAGGFVGELFQGNTIDSRGGKAALPFVFVGNHFGTRVVRNHLLGADTAFKITSGPTEQPVYWGWSYAPMLGLTIEDNTIEDSEKGGLLGVEHAAWVRSSKGRVYMSVALNGNVVRWSPSFLASRGKKADSSLPVGLTVGTLPVADPGDLVVRARDNRLQAPGSARANRSLVVNAAQLNGRTATEQAYALPLDPEPARQAVRPGAGVAAPSR